jgi:hypothetical protein
VRLLSLQAGVAAAQIIEAVALRVQDAYLFDVRALKEGLRNHSRHAWT